MDEATKTLVSNFVDFLVKEVSESKEYKSFQIGTWSLKDFRITVKVFYEGKTKEIFFDVRELKDNPDRFRHLLPNALDQLKQLKSDSFQ